MLKTICDILYDFHFLKYILSIIININRLQIVLSWCDQVLNTCHGLSSSTSSPGRWIPSDQDHLDKSSAPITLSLDNLAPAIIGQKAITRKGLSLSTLSWMLSERKPRVVTVSRDSS